MLEGRVGALIEGEEAFADAGSLLFKPRGQWHTFWNATDEPARMLELISPGGFEQAFRDLAAQQGEIDPETMTELASRYGVEVDFERTGPILEGIDSRSEPRSARATRRALGAAPRAKPAFRVTGRASTTAS